jgi:hypothetical protein
MVKKCPPGILCIENNTILTIFLLLTILGVIVYFNIYKSNNQESKVVVVERNQHTQNNPYFNKPSTILSPFQNDLFLNPYSPPLKENRFFPMNNHDVRGVPINMQTSHYNLTYKQVGILTRENGKETILPIFGRPLHSNRNKWQYYTMTDKNNMIRLPVSKNGKSCTNDYGCDELFNGDNVYVEGYKDSFNVTIYENDRPTYIPYL